LCNLILSNAKRNEKDYEFPFCFELISATNKKAFLLQGETEKEAEEWVFAIRNAIANSISQYQTDTKSSPKLKSSDIMYYPDSISIKENNRDTMIEKLIQSSKCLDCDSECPTWCSIDWLSLICIDCSGVHRSLGVQISKIRSLRLDNLEPELIELIDFISLEKINSILEFSVKSYEKPKPNSMYSEKENFITNKYKLKKFFKSGAQLLPGLVDIKNSSLNVQGCATACFKFIDSDNLISIYHLIKLELCEINKLYECDKEKYSFLHHSAKKGKINSFKLLIILGADLSLIDAKNLKAIDYATIYKNVNIYLIL
jgi:hypothetical protein